MVCVMNQQNWVTGWRMVGPSIGDVIKEAFPVEEALELRLERWEGAHHGIACLVHHFWLPCSHNIRVVTETMFPTNLRYWWSGSLRKFDDPFSLVLVSFETYFTGIKYSVEEMTSAMLCCPIWLSVATRVLVLSI